MGYIDKIDQPSSPVAKFFQVLEPLSFLKERVVRAPPEVKEVEECVAIPGQLSGFDEVDLEKGCTWNSQAGASLLKHPPPKSDVLHRYTIVSSSVTTDEFQLMSESLELLMIARRRPEKCSIDFWLPLNECEQQAPPVPAFCMRYQKEGDEWLLVSSRCEGCAHRPFHLTCDFLGRGQQVARVQHSRRKVEKCSVHHVDLYAVCNRVHQELQTRRAEGDGKYFGDVYGYEDTGQRWDLKLQLSSEVKQALTLMLQHVQGVLESLRPSWQLTELAAMCTFPEDPGQPVHADTSHVYDQQVVTIFVALHDISPERGPTKMYPKSHLDGELHLGIKEVDESSAVLCTMSCGDCVLMDSRLLHCGTANTSDLHRFLFYSSWMPPARRSRGSTNTILPEYEDGLSLRDWQQWTS